jgi:hypothetical protein
MCQPNAKHAPILLKLIYEPKLYNGLLKRTNLYIPITKTAR